MAFLWSLHIMPVCHTPWLKVAAPDPLSTLFSLPPPASEADPSAKNTSFGVERGLDSALFVKVWSIWSQTFLDHSFSTPTFMWSVPQKDPWSALHHNTLFSWDGEGKGVHCWETDLQETLLEQIQRRPKSYSSPPWGAQKALQLLPPGAQGSPQPSGPVLGSVPKLAVLTTPCGDKFQELWRCHSVVLRHFILLPLLRMTAYPGIPKGDVINKN